MSSNRPPNPPPSRSSLAPPPNESKTLPAQTTNSSIRGHIRAKLSTTEEGFTVRSRLNTDSTTSIPLREAASIRVRPLSKRKVSPAQTVLSDFDRNRKMRASSNNLMDQLRELLPAVALPGADQEPRSKLTNEDEDAELRRISVEQPLTGWHRKVYRTSPITQANQNTEPNPLEAESSAIIASQLEASVKDADGYSNTAYLENIAQGLAGANIVTTNKQNAAAGTKSLKTQTQKSSSSKSNKEHKRHRRAAAFAQVKEIAREDDEQFRSHKLKLLIKQEFIPQHAVSQKPQAPPAPRSKGCFCGKLFAWKNCGTCYFVKVYIVSTLLAAILWLCLTDQCYVKSLYGSHTVASTINPSTFRSNWSTSPPTTKPVSTNKSFHLLAKGIRRGVRSSARPTPPFAVSLQLARPRLQHLYQPANVVILHRSMHLTESRSKLGNVSETSTIQSLVQSKNLHCSFKVIYFVWLVVGVAAYLTIFVVYTRKMVLQYPDFSWYLAEALILLAYSVVLLIISIVTYVLRIHVYANTLGFLDALLGIMIGLSLYSSHKDGLTPLLNVTVDDDPDKNQANRILGEKQFNKLFNFGKTP